MTSRTLTNVRSAGSENFIMGRDKSAIVFEIRHTCSDPAKRVFENGPSQLPRRSIQNYALL